MIDVALMDLLKKDLPGCPYLQLTVTEQEEEYRSGDRLEYRSPLTTVQVWIDKTGGECGHLAVAQMRRYAAYDADLVGELIDDVAVMTSRFLQRYLSGSTTS